MVKKNQGKIIYVAMSGGVDSSVAASILKEQGYNVVGVYMKTWSPPGQPCPWKKDRQDVMRVCAQLKIPFKNWDFTGEYKGKVVDYMIREYSSGRTPNPDVMCNREIKFGLFFKKALKEGADYVATGHYARVFREDASNKKQDTNKLQTTNYKLVRGRDLNKDQSYFLWALTQKHLEKTLFPIGEFKSKEEVRSYARERGLATSEKKDSQGVCFIGPINVEEFLRQRISASAGPIVSVTGRKLGQHTGLPFYTIGQRQGIGIGGTGPYYVARKEEKTNTLVVAPPAYEEELLSESLVATDIHWIGSVPADNKKVGVQIRYRQQAVPVTLKKISTNKWQVNFNEPIRAVTPGQSVVFYKEDVLLGGGIIS